MLARRFNGGLIALIRKSRLRVSPKRQNPKSQSREMGFRVLSMQPSILIIDQKGMILHDYDMTIIYPIKGLSIDC